MKVYYDSMSGPQRCEVVCEIDATFVKLKPIGYPGGPFGFIEPGMSSFVTHKSECWVKARALNQYGTRHELSGRPKWGVSADKMDQPV